MERFRCLGADFFRQCRAINRANARTRTCVLETQGEPCVALLKVEPETEFTFAALVRTLAALFLSTAFRISLSKLERETEREAYKRMSSLASLDGPPSFYLKLREIGVILRMRGARDQEEDDVTSTSSVADRVNVNNGVLSERGPPVNKRDLAAL